MAVNAVADGQQHCGDVEVIVAANAAAVGFDADEDDDNKIVASINAAVADAASVAVALVAEGQIQVKRLQKT